MHPRLSLRHGSWKIRSTPFTGSNETGRGRVNRSPTSNAWFSSGNVTNTSLETAVSVGRCPEVNARQRSRLSAALAAVAARGVGFSFWRISSHGFGHRPEKCTKRAALGQGGASACDRMAAGGSCERKLALQRGLQGSDPSSSAVRRNS
jgi:hypothetical protein